jgi:DNA-binding beta-propeller fold protein YncE
MIFCLLVVLAKLSLAADGNLVAHKIYTIGGSEDPLLSLPTDVAVSAKHIMVVNGGNHRIAVFDLKGRLQFRIGSMGTDPGYFLDPVGIATDEKGRIIVADKSNHRIQVFDSKGHFVKKFSVIDDGKLIRPVDVVFDSGQQLYFVTGNNNHRVMVFNEQGLLINKWGGSGAEESEFNFPATVALHSSSRIAIVDVLNTRVQVFDLNGKYQFKMGLFGTLPGRFFRPKGIGVDDTGRIFVSDSYMGVIQVFSESGEYLAQLGAHNPQEKLLTPTGITVGGKRLYIAEMIANKISVYELD